MTVDKIRPLLAFAFVACLCAGVLAAGMNRAPQHRVVTESRIPATALPRENTLVLGSTLQGRPVVPAPPPSTTPLSQLSGTGVVSDVVSAPAVAVASTSRPRTAAHTGASAKPTTRPARHTRTSTRTRPPATHTPAPVITQPVTGNPSAPGQVKKAKKQQAKQQPVLARQATSVTATKAVHGKGHARKPAKNQSKNQTKKQSGKKN